MSGISQPGMKGDIRALERRIATLERDLMPYRPTDAVLLMDGGEASRQRVLAKPMGSADGFLLPFTLGRNKKGATITYGALMAHFQMINVEYRSIVPDGGGSPVTFFAVSYQDEIIVPAPQVPLCFSGKERWKPVDLEVFGDIYLTWAANTDGSITQLDVTDEPLADDPIPELVKVDDFLVRSRSTGTYRIKLGNVPSKGRIEQDISGHVYWSPVIISAGCV